MIISSEQINYRAVCPGEDHWLCCLPVQQWSKCTALHCTLRIRSVTESMRVYLQYLQCSTVTSTVLATITSQVFMYQVLAHLDCRLPVNRLSASDAVTELP